MNPFEDPDGPDKDHCRGEDYVGPGTKDTQVQLVISLALGLSAFLAFCVRLSLVFRVLRLFPFLPSTPR